MKPEPTRIALDRQAAQTMIHRVPTTRLAVAAHVSGWLSKLISVWSRGLALTCLLLVMCIADGVSRSEAANEQKPSEQKSPERKSPEQKSSSKGVARAKTEAAPAATAAADQQFLARRRMAIALMLERSLDYRTAFDVKLFNAQLAGPFWYETRNAFLSSETHPELLYCVEAKLDILGLPYPAKHALIRVWQASNGQAERLEATLSKYTHLQCQKADYQPFPELEQARAKRRAALGKTD